MNFRAVLFIAIRCLVSTRSGKNGQGGRYLFGAALGIMLSLVPIIVTLIVADGMIWGITDRFIELGTGHIQVWDNRDRSDWKDRKEAAAAADDRRGGHAARLEAAKQVVTPLKRVRGAWAEIQGAGIILGYHGKTGVTIRAAEAGFWQDPGSRRYLEVIEGTAEITGDRDALIGRALAETAGAGVGDTIRVMTVRETPDGRSIPRTSLFTVKGIISAGYHELDALWCVISYEAGQRILDPALSSSYLMVKIDEPYRAARESMFEILAALSYEYGVYTWQQLHEAQYRSYESTRQMLLFIMALIVLVAAVNLSSALSMLTIERYRDIAILGTMGAAPAAISAIFIWAGLFTGILGAALGLAAGLLIGVSINQLVHGLEYVLSFFSGLLSGGDIKILDPGFYLENIPIVINWTTVWTIAFFTVLCSAAAAFLPALRAGRQKPASLLRKL